jgi:hypothetical protein
MALTPIPTFPPIGSGTFNADAYNWATFMAGTHQTELDALVIAVDTDATIATAQAVSAAAQAVIAATHETNAATQATLAAGSALTSGAVIWITDLIYAAGDVRYSTVDYQVYRRKTSGAGSLDPSADSINWALANNIIADQTGNSGKFLKTNGITTSWANEQVIPTAVVFTASGTWTCPTGVTRAKITVVGGGASSNAKASYNSLGGPGGGAAVGWRTVIPGTTYTVVVGAGGASAGASGDQNGNGGGTSSFSGSGIATLSASGGGSSLAAETYTSGGMGFGGDINVAGGGTDVNINATPYGYSAGGGSLLTQGARHGSQGLSYGGGGGGMPANAGSNAGYQGVVIVEY